MGEAAAEVRREGECLIYIIYECQNTIISEVVRERCICVDLR
jgi:hypothetical protein